MKNSVSEKFYATGQKLIASGSNVADALNQGLNELLPFPFRVAPGSIAGSQGERTSTFGTLIRVAKNESHSSSVEVPADVAACAVDVTEVMDLERLRAAYGRIVEAKAVKKASVPNTAGAPQTNVTLGIIFALNASVPMEAMAEELDLLNRKTPGAQWVDMVVILSHGIINYGVHFPGEDISADFLPPAPGALVSYTPPIYVVTMIRPTETFSFNKMCSFLVAHLSLFAPGAKLPHFQQLLDGTPTTVITMCGYQYNLRGELLPVPRQFYNDRYLPPRPVRIEDDRGCLLSTVQFLPWQDGGVVLLDGKLPLEGLLIFLGGQALQRGGIVRRNGLQISYVLPITQANFVDMLQRIQRQSNMVVSKDHTKVVVQKFADEGAASPFMARLFLGVLKLRDQAFAEQSKRHDFDNAFDFVLTELVNARATAQEITLTFQRHVHRLSKGEVAQMQGDSIRIDENIDLQLGKQVDNFLIGAARALKYGVQTLAKTLQVDIGFLFQGPAEFTNGLAKLEKSDPLLAEYLKQVREWSERLQKTRIAVEHYGWKLPKLKYAVRSGVVCIEEPEVSGQKVTEFVKFFLDRLMCFVEEVTTHCLQTKLPAGTSITELALPERQPEAPVRFQVTLISGGRPIWHIRYHQSIFEET